MKTKNHKIKASIILAALLGTIVIASGVTSAATTSDSPETMSIKQHSRNPLDYIIITIIEYDDGSVEIIQIVV